MSSKPAISVAILCGGRSSRFGTECKILHKIDDKYMFQILFEKFQEFTTDIFLQLSTEIQDVLTQNIDREILSNYQTYLDIYDNKGPLSGIYSALTHAKKPNVFIIAADLPCTDTAILQELLKYPDHQLIIPRWGSGYYEPLCAVYSRELLGLIKSQIDDDKLSIHELFENDPPFKVKYINIDELINKEIINENCFKNINTIRDL